jgi:hypothetical protein
VPILSGNDKINGGVTLMMLRGNTRARFGPKSDFSGLSVAKTRERMVGERAAIGAASF